MVPRHSRLLKTSSKFSPSGFVAQLVFKLSYFLLNYAHLLCVYERCVLLEKHAIAYFHEPISIQVDTCPPQLHTLKKFIKGNLDTHPSCPFSVHDSIPFSFNGTERLFVIWRTERETENFSLFSIKTSIVVYLKLAFELWFDNDELLFAIIFLLQNLSGDPVLLPSIKRFGMEHNVSTVARLGAGDVALPTQLHPWHSQNRPGQMRSGSARYISM